MSGIFKRLDVSPGMDIGMILKVVIRPGNDFEGGFFELRKKRSRSHNLGSFFSSNLISTF